MPLGSGFPLFVQTAWCDMSSLMRKSVMALEAYTPGEQPKVADLVKLNTNENPYPPSPKVAEALRSIPIEQLRLYPDPVFSQLQTRIAEIHGCAPECVMAGNGADELLALCTRTFVEHDGSIGYFDPSYSLYPVLTDIREVERRPVELSETFEWQMPEGYGASLFFLTNPNAPTGMLHDKEQIVSFCRAFDGVVVIDEAYVDFARYNCIDLALSEPNVLVMRTLSKAFSLARIRSGYAVGAPALVAALFKVKDSYNLDGITQALALAALQDLEWMQANTRKIIATRERLTNALTALGFVVMPSEANFVWTRPPAGRDAATVFAMLRQANVLVRYFPGEKTGAFLRITVGTDEQIDRLLQVLREENEDGNA